jgi:hypothetical protein
MLGDPSSCMNRPYVDSEPVVGTLPSELSGAPHRRPMSSRQISIRARDWEGSVVVRGGIHGVQDTQFQRSQAVLATLPTRRQPGDGVTWTRKGTLGSIAGAGDPSDPTVQALLIARPRLSRALWASWSKRVVALVSESQLTAVAPFMLPAHAALEGRCSNTGAVPQRHGEVKSRSAKSRSSTCRMRTLPSHLARDLMRARVPTGPCFW